LLREINDNKKGELVMQKKRMVVLFVLLVFGSFLCFASGSQEEATPEPVRYIGVLHEWTNVIEEMIPEFTAETGIPVEFESYTEEQLSNKLATESAAMSKDLDVFNFRPLQDGLIFSQNGWIEPLNSYFEGDAEYDAADLSPGALGTCTVDGEVIAIPLITEAEVLYYNKAMFAEKGLEPPKTLEEMMEVAEMLTDRENGVYGVVSRGARSASVTQFSSYLRNFGGSYMTDGDASVNTPEALQAYEFYGDMLRNFGPPGVLNFSWPQCAELFAQGKVGMYTDASSLYNAVASPDKSNIAGDVGVALFPAGPAGNYPYNVTAWSIAMGANSDNKENAWEFIKWLTSKEMMLATQKAGITMARKSAWEDPESNKSFTADFIETALESAAIGTPFDRPRVVRVQEARDIIGTVIVTAIEGGDFEEAADVAQKDFQALIDEEK
jgi:multiple sugar transport system substrate-binding protein